LLYQEEEAEEQTVTERTQHNVNSNQITTLEEKVDDVHNCRKSNDNLDNYSSIGKL
jgi:hypothetical protein